MTGPTPTSPHRLAYDDLDAAEQQRLDCEAVTAQLRLAAAADRATSGRVPSLHFEDYPREVVKRDIAISDAAARIAAALHLHLD